MIFKKSHYKKTATNCPLRYLLGRIVCEHKYVSINLSFLYMYVDYTGCLFVVCA